jgi:hypothetical protein
MKRIFSFLSIFLLLLILSGCEDPQRLKNVQKLAITGISFDKEIPVLIKGKDGQIREHNPFIKLNMSGLHIGPEWSDDDQKFFDDFMNDIILTLEKETDIDYLDVEEFYDYDEYRSLPEKPRKAFVYVPDPFRFIDIQNPEYAKTLCLSLDVDAVANFTFQYKKLRNETNKVGIFDLGSIPIVGGLVGTEKMRLCIEVQVIDNEGIAIFSRSFYIDSRSENIKLNLLGDFFSVNLNNAQIYQEPANLFIEHLLNMFKAARY